jgi:hypothetical protein
MKRLRHPIRAIREPFGTAGLVVACVALIAALGGTALAAKGALTGKQKKEVEKIAKKFAGKPGAPGAAGANGANGKDGAAGANGKDGTSGASAKNVVLTTLTPGQEGCVEGGTKVEVEGNPASKKAVCNGVEGLEGEPGDPWTAGGTLPAGATETGVFAQQTSAESGEAGIFAPISFPILLDADTTTSVSGTVVPSPIPSHIKQVGSEGDGGVCPGDANSPQAAPGYLCIYENAGLAAFNATYVGVKKGPSVAEGVLGSGGFVEFSREEAGLSVVAGSFAVTGCSTSLPAGEPDKCP